MTDTLDILRALAGEFKRCLPETGHYFGSLPERHKPPCFLWMPVHRKEKRLSYFSREIRLDIQTVYFAREDGYNGQSFAAKAEAQQALRPFLDSFILPVGERVLNFEYSFSEADEHLTVNLAFRFRGSTEVAEFDKAQAQPTVQAVFLNEGV